MTDFDPINPDYYKQGDKQCIEYTENWPHCIAAAVKYMWRYKDKENPKLDLEKAIWYLRREITNMREKRQGKLYYTSHQAYISESINHIESRNIKEAINQIWGRDFKGVVVQDIQRAIASIGNELELLKYKPEDENEVNTS